MLLLDLLSVDGAFYRPCPESSFDLSAISLNVPLLSFVLSFLSEKEKNIVAMSSRGGEVAKQRCALVGVDERTQEYESDDGPSRAVEAIIGRTEIREMEGVWLDLSFFHAPLPFKELKLTNLVSLNLSGCSWVEDRTLRHLAYSVKKLKVLNLYWCANVTDLGLKFLLSANAGLKQISFSGLTRISDHSIEHVSRFCPEVVHLDLTRCMKLSDVSLEILAESQIAENLISLNLYSTTVFSPHAYDTLGRFINLKFLDVAGHTKLQPDNFKKATRKWRGMRHLNLSWCLSLDDSCIRMISESCENLEFLSLFGLKDLSLSAIESLFSLKKLRALDIRGVLECQDLTLEDCEGLRIRLPQLRRWKLHS